MTTMNKTTPSQSSITKHQNKKREDGSSFGETGGKKDSKSQKLLQPSKPITPKEEQKARAEQQQKDAKLKEAITKTDSYLASPSGNRLHDFVHGIGEALTGKGLDRLGNILKSEEERTQIYEQELQKQIGELGYDVQLAPIETLTEGPSGEKVGELRGANITGGGQHVQLVKDMRQMVPLDSGRHLGPHSVLESDVLNITEGGKSATSSQETRQPTGGEGWERRYEQEVVRPSGGMERGSSPIKESLEERVDELLALIRQGKFNDSFAGLTPKRLKFPWG